MQYTQNPELDAAANDDEAEAHDELMQKAQVEAPKIVLDKLKKIQNSADWFAGAFHGLNSADEILQDALADCDDDMMDAYAEYMVTPTPDKRELMLKAMANHFSKTYAFEIYEDYCRDLA